MAKHIAIYGKGGTGKTTIAANLAAALAEACHRVLLVGCSPTADSSHLLCGETVPALLFPLLENGANPAVERIITSGYRGIGCIELGEPSGTDCCASRNIASIRKSILPDPCSSIPEEIPLSPEMRVG